MSKVQVEEVSFLAGRERLAGLRVLGGSASQPSVLFLHGAGRASSERGLPLAERLAARGISSFLFDFSGHGRSTGSLEESSLAKRIDEARTALQFLDAAIQPALCGFSMGGHVALELIRERRARGLGLFYPAIYSVDAIDIAFNAGFANIIRQANSWRRATVPYALEEFQGRLFLVIGERDNVIPAEVVDWLLSSARAAAETTVRIVPDAPHALLPVIYSSGALLDDVVVSLSRVFEIP